MWQIKKGVTNYFVTPLLGVEGGSLGLGVDFLSFILALGRIEG